MTAFFVEGKPAPKGSKSFKGMRGGHAVLVESAVGLPKWVQQVARTVRQHHTGGPIVGPVTMRLQFVLPRPKALPKSKPTPPAIKRNGDTDKLARAVLDAIDGYAYLDDSQVVDCHASKRIAELSEATGCWVWFEAGEGAAALEHADRMAA